jgi:hypothetical protein
VQGLYRDSNRVPTTTDVPMSKFLKVLNRSFILYLSVNHHGPLGVLLAVEPFVALEEFLEKFNEHADVCRSGHFPNGMHCQLWAANVDSAVKPRVFLSQVSKKKPGQTEKGTLAVSRSWKRWVRLWNRRLSR